MIIDGAIRRELLSTGEAGRPQPFEKTALVGDGLLYIETGRIKTAGQAERFARMIDRLCDVADKVDSAPRPMPGVASQPGGVSRGVRKAARRKVMRLVDELGFDPVDAGDLEDSWRQQPGTPCYAADLDAVRLKEALAATDRGRLPEYRAEADEAARAFFASQP